MDDTTAAKIKAELEAAGLNNNGVNSFESLAKFFEIMANNKALEGMEIKTNIPELDKRQKEAIERLNRLKSEKRTFEFK